MRGRRVFAIAAMIGSLTFGGAMVFSAGGCSGSVDTSGPATQDEEAQKNAQEKMKEFMAQKNASKGQKKK